MTIVSRFRRRKSRNGLIKARSPQTKLRSNYGINNLPLMEPRSKIDIHLARMGSNKPIDIGPATMKVIEMEVSDLISSKPVSVSAMANALAGSAKVADRHAKECMHTSLLRKLANLTVNRRKSTEQSLKIRYILIDAFNRLEKRLDSPNIKVSNWEEAKDALSAIIKFPAGEELALLQREDQESRDETQEKYSRSLTEAFLDSGASTQMKEKWRQVAAFPIPAKLDGSSDREIEAHRTALEKADNLFKIRVDGATEQFGLPSETVREVEERLKEEEAKKRASSLMRPLTDDEQGIVRNAMYGMGPDDEVLARAGADTVQRQSMQTLQPGQWLNDEVIHHFYLMLSKRDEEMCEKDPSRKRSHFFKSFFITKLLNEGHSDPNMDGTYEYRNVKRWSKKVPGKDIFNLDKVFFPINQGRMHWLCGVADITNKRVQIYDSMGGGSNYLESIFQYLQDEHMDKKKTPLPDIDDWELIECTSDTPRQRNGKCTVVVASTSRIAVLNSALSLQDMTVEYLPACLRISCRNRAHWYSRKSTLHNAESALCWP